MRYRNSILAIAGLMVGGCAPAAAQQTPFGFGGTMGSEREGLRVLGASVTSAYFSSGIPIGFGQGISTGNLGVASHVWIGGSTGVGWFKSRRNYSVSIQYTPSYFTSIETPELSTVNHSFALSSRVKFGSKWTFGFSASVVASDLQQMLFGQSLFGALTAVPSTFDDLSGALLTGRYSNDQLASLLTGAPLASSPESAYFYGSRLLTAGLRPTLRYEYSARLSIGFNSYGTRNQFLHRSGVSAAESVPVAIPQTTSIGGGVQISYSLTPRTHVALDLTAYRTISRLQDSYGSMVSGSIGHTINRYWFVQARFGSGYQSPLRQTINLNQGTQYVYGGSVGLKVSSHTFMGNYDRTVGDTYGLGASTTGSAGAAWNWRVPGSVWSLNAVFGYQTLNGPAFPDTTSYRITAGVVRKLGEHFSISTSYGYFRIPTYLNLLTSPSQNGVTMALSWTPSVVR